MSARSPQGTKGNVTFSIGIVAKKSTGRNKSTGRIRPRYVSPSTESLQVLTDGANPVVVNLMPSSPNCSPNPNVPEGYICTTSFSVATGNHVFTVSTYDVADAKGQVLSTSTTGTVFVKPTGKTTVPIVLAGVVQYVRLTLATANPPAGKAGAIGLAVSVEDADGNFIVGAAPYDHPVTLTTSDSAHGPLSRRTLSSPADTAGVSVNYSGAKVASIAYSATALGLPVSHVVGAELTPGGQLLYVTNQGDPYSGAGANVSVFSLANPAAPPTLIAGTNWAEGAAIDASGKLYVADIGDDRVTIIDTAQFNAFAGVITGDGLTFPWSVAVDASGKLFVGSITFDGVSGKVSVFDTLHGNAELPAISIGGPSGASGLAVDANAKLYVANGNRVSIFDTAHGNAALPPITGGGLSTAAGLAVGADGKLYVANEGTASVSVFDTLHANAALPAITGGGLSAPLGVAVDAGGKLYVVNNGATSLRVFDVAHGNVPLPAIPIPGVTTPQGVAVH